MQDSLSFNFGRNFTTTLNLRNKADFKNLLSACRSPIIMDKQVYELHRDLFNPSFDPKILLLPAGEQTKTQATVKLIYDHLLKCKADRNTEVFVIGGGTITDVAAYAVSTFKRGCRLTLIPSTLLGMIDAALGGKTALNYRSIKNLIGSLYPAERVVILPELLSTLPETELHNGLAEMLKLKFILPELSEPCFKEAGYPATDQIFEYAQAKLNICVSDLDDRGMRRLLNLGHTFGHTLESYTNYAIPHGAAIVWGIATAARTSNKLGYIDQNVCNGIITKLKAHGFKSELDTTIKAGFLAAFPDLVLHDKKKEGDILTLILFKGSGQVDIFEEISLPIEPLKFLSTE